MIEQIKSPADLRRLSHSELETLAAELREKIIRTVAANGGHLASNLGTVELTIALHRVFDSPRDKLIFDVGHQSYVHKLLTGRFDRFDTLRQKGGISGFTNRAESAHDPFGSGHSGNSLSAAIGLASAMKMDGDPHYVVAVIGDGAFTNGMIYEALNNCANHDLHLIIILNDNEMSISENVGGLSGYFTKLSTNQRYFHFKHMLQTVFLRIPFIGNALVGAARAFKNLIKRLIWKGTIFEYLGLDYIGPADTASITRLEDVLREAKRQKKCCLVHVVTQKGKGYAPAERQPERYHSVSGLCADGEPPRSTERDFSTVFGEIMAAAAEKDDALCAVTAAMTRGTGLDAFSRQHPERFHDVGIAEEHAVTFCGGLSAGEKHPVFAVYSCFAQRTYDQLIHDIAIQRLPMIMAIDRAGFVPGDGITHQGIYDVSMFSDIPFFSVYSPADEADMVCAFDEALAFREASAIRYPKGRMLRYGREAFQDHGWMSHRDFGSGTPRIVIITYGRMVENAVRAAELLSGDYPVRVIKLLKVKPIDYDALFALCRTDTDTFAPPALLYLLEEGIAHGGVAESIAAACTAGAMSSHHILIHALDGGCTYQGTVADLEETFGYTPTQIEAELRDAMHTASLEECVAAQQ